MNPHRTFLLYCPERQGKLALNRIDREAGEIRYRTGLDFDVSDPERGWKLAKRAGWRVTKLLVKRQSNR